MAIETLLLAVDMSDRDRVEALAEAVADVAGPTGARVVLLHVFTDAEFEASASRLDFDRPSDATPQEIATRHHSIRDIGELLTAVDVDYEIAGRLGEHGDSIVAEAEDIDADMVFVGGRERSPAGKAVFGSTAQQVLLEAPCPVTFVRSD